MELIGSRGDFRDRMQSARDKGDVVGLVPTMGALHPGHLSLVVAAQAHCQTVAVSIFVNPTQFGDAADLAAYPRDLATDLALCEDAGIDVAFAPSLEEMYPFGRPLVTLDPGELGSVLEGASRPGHFAGVGTVVTKLLSLTGACHAYFGEKDFQQLAVIRRLVLDLDIPVVVEGCPIVRELDGLAMSSRNRRLSDRGRAVAGALSAALAAGAAVIADGEQHGATVVAVMEAALVGESLVELDYAVVADRLSLANVEVIDREVRLLVAARVEDVRLIDNLAATPPKAT